MRCYLSTRSHFNIEKIDILANNNGHEIDLKNTTKEGIPNRSFRNIFPNLCFCSMVKVSYHKKSIVKSIENRYAIRGYMNTQDSE